MPILFKCWSMQVDNSPPPLPPPHPQIFLLWYFELWPIVNTVESRAINFILAHPQRAPAINHDIGRAVDMCVCVCVWRWTLCMHLKVQ
jgi:hypothetical protein